MKPAIAVLVLMLVAVPASAVDDVFPPVTELLAVTSAAAIAPGWTSASWSVSLSCMDGVDGREGTGCATTEYAVGGGELSAYEAPFGFEDEARYPVAYRSTDLAGNVEELKETQLGIDRGAPSASMEGSVDVIVPSIRAVGALFVNGEDPALPNGDAGSGVWAMCLRVSDALSGALVRECIRATPRTDDGSWAAFPDLPSGVYEVRAIPTDGAGNVGEPSAPELVIVVA